MRYSLLLHYREPAAGEIDPETMEAAMRAFQAYADALHSAGVLVAAVVGLDQLRRRVGRR